MPRPLWLFREQLACRGLIEKLFRGFDEQLWQSGLIPRGGQIIDASLVNLTKNRNTQDENKQIKEGKTPEGWDDKPNMKRRIDEDARWTQKHGKSYYGYKNHVNIDKEHKLIRRYGVTDASVHDSQVFGDQRTAQGSILAWTKGKVRAAVKIGMMNLTYNMRRCAFLLRSQSLQCTG